MAGFAFNHQMVAMREAKNLITSYSGPIETVKDLRRKAPQLFMNVLSRNWLSRKGAAEKLDVSVDTIERRAIPWQDEPVPGKLRYKCLKLGEETRQDRRYCEEDLEALLVP